MPAGRVDLVVNGLLGWLVENLAIVVVTLIGFIVKMHLDHDRDFKARIEREIEKIKESL